MANCSATTNGAWFGNITPPEPTLIRSVLAARCAMSTGGVVLATADHPLVFATSVVIWGFFFWMAVPGVFAALAARSANPSDRAGDAQAIMAAGRVVGPFIGGLVFDAAGATALGFTGAAIIAAAAGVVFAVRSMVEPAAA